MKDFGGWKLPDREVHLCDWMAKRNEVVDGRLAYQWHKLSAALALATDWRGAIDVGAHVGLMSWHLAKHFGQTFAFEPIVAHRECFVENVLPGDWDATLDEEIVAGLGTDHHVRLYPYACGEAAAWVRMRTDPTSSGDTYPDPAYGTGDVAVVRLDDILPDDAAVGFCKLDCEGYELFALRGAEQMLRRCHPVVMVEQKVGKASKYGLGDPEAVDYLRSLGAHLRHAISGDYIMSWN